MKAMTGLIATALAVLLMASCEGESTKPTYHYRAPFDPAMVDGVEEFMKGLADRWELSRKEKKLTSFGPVTFSMALFLKSDPKGDWILYILNTGIGEFLDLALFEHEDMPLSELQRLDKEVRSGLKERFGIELEPYVEPHDRDDTTARNSPERADNL